MCRWLAYSGSPVSLEDLLFKPKNSLVVQSQHSKLGATTTNGDGFGVGWYGAGDRRRGLPEHRAGVERPQPARAGRPGELSAGVRAHPGLDGFGGAADQLPPVPARALAVDAQRDARGVPDDEAGPGDGRGPGPVPGDRGVHGLGDAVLPGPDPRAGGRPAGGGGQGGRVRRGDRPRARDRVPGADDRGDHGRRHHVGVPLLQRGPVALAVPQHGRVDAAGAAPRQPGAARAVGGRPPGGVRAAGRPAGGVARGPGVFRPHRPRRTGRSCSDFAPVEPG